MKVDQQVVVSMPIADLWNLKRTTKLKKQRFLGSGDVIETIRQGNTDIVVAEIGKPLEWISPERTYSFWKSEASHRFVEPEKADAGFHLEDMPGQYCYHASEWGDGEGLITILLEKHH